MRRGSYELSNEDEQPMTNSYITGLRGDWGFKSPLRQFLFLFMIAFRSYHPISGKHL